MTCRMIGLVREKRESREKRGKKRHRSPGDSPGRKAVQETEKQRLQFDDAAENQEHRQGTKGHEEREGNKPTKRRNAFDGSAAKEDCVGGGGKEREEERVDGRGRGNNNSSNKLFLLLVLGTVTLPCLPFFLLPSRRAGTEDVAVIIIQMQKNSLGNKPTNGEISTHEVTFSAKGTSMGTSTLPWAVPKVTLSVPRGVVSTLLVESIAILHT